jgi:hypothetical protein
MNKGKWFTRIKPGQTIVDKEGNKYTNESLTHEVRIIIEFAVKEEDKDLK